VPGPARPTAADVPAVEQAGRLSRDLRTDRGGARNVLRAVRRGLLKGQTASGRPADGLVMPDGALLVSDDKAGRIYRISYEGR
jgi:glucose/arabinose dehydrogenase